METPVLLIIFNRPDTTKIVFDAIRKAKPRKLYISADAPRKGNLKDKMNCQRTREIVKNLDWDCDVQYRLLDENLGCGLGVSSAINWAFETTDRLIILEDDCVPSLSFFSFCDYCLDKYEDDLRVWEISGLNHFNGKKNLVQEDSYFFSKYAPIWGWATWSNRWKEANVYMLKFQKFLDQKYIYDHVNRKDALAALKIHKNFYRLLQSEKSPHTWDFQWWFSIWSNRGMGIIPSMNLITNIGYIGIHSKESGLLHDIPANEDFVVSKDPDFIQTNYLYDDEYFRVFIKKPSFSQKLCNKVAREFLTIKRKLLQN